MNEIPLNPAAGVVLIDDDGLKAKKYGYIGVPCAHIARTGKLGPGGVAKGKVAETK